MTYLKVLSPTGEPVHGGSGAYPLPTQRPDGSWEPGDWTRTLRSVAVCEHGYHLTEKPEEWFTDGAVLWEAEGRGATSTDGSDKTAFASVRLLRPADWGENGIWTEGEHVATEGLVRAYGSATVRAYGSATVISSPYHSASAVVALSHLAAHVDRRGGKLAFRKAGGA